jgi:hypothetical protein
MTDYGKRLNPPAGHSISPHRKVVSREGAAIRIEKTELTGALKRSLTGGSGRFGERKSLAK